MVGYGLIISYLSSIALTLLIAYPVYKKFEWDQYELIGLDIDLQKAFATVQLGKSSYLTIFLDTIIQGVTIIYFESNIALTIVEAIFIVLFLVLIRWGYECVVLPADDSCERRRRINWRCS